MNIKDIHLNLWWMPNTWDVGNLVPDSFDFIQSARRLHGRFDKGALVFNNNLGDVLAEQPKIYSNLDPSLDRTLDFVLDVGNIHIENMKPDDSRKFTFPSIWPTIDGTFLNPILSLRVSGYLVDCWQAIGHITINKATAQFHNCTFVSTMPEIKTNFYLDGISIRGNFPNPANKTAVFLYTRPDMDCFDMVRYFNQHHRNFFLAFAK